MADAWTAFSKELQGAVGVVSYMRAKPPLCLSKKKHPENLLHASFSLCSWGFQVEKEGSELVKKGGGAIDTVKEEWERVLGG